MRSSYSYHLLPCLTYHLSAKLPKELKSFLPTVDEIIERLSIFDEKASGKDHG